MRSLPFSHKKADQNKFLDIKKCIFLYQEIELLISRNIFLHIKKEIEFLISKNRILDIKKSNS